MGALAGMAGKAAADDAGDNDYAGQSAANNMWDYLSHLIRVVYRSPPLGNVGNGALE